MNTKNATILGVAAIVVAGIIAFAWFKIDANRQREATEQKRLDQQTEVSTQAKDNLSNSLLQTCIDNATTGYPWENVQADIKRDPDNSQQYLDLYYKMKSEEESTCKIRYAN